MIPIKHTEVTEMKKLLALLTAALLCAALLPLHALAAGEVVNVYNWYDYMDETVFDLFE